MVRTSTPFKNRTKSTILNPDSSGLQIPTVFEFSGMAVAVRKAGMEKRGWLREGLVIALACTVWSAMILLNYTRHWSLQSGYNLENILKIFDFWPTKIHEPRSR